MPQTTKRAVVFSGMLTAIIVGVFAMAYLTASAANRFSFSGRGLVKESNRATGVIKVNFTHMSRQASGLALGHTIDVSVAQASILKPNAAKELVRIKQGNIAIGDEVTVTGNVRTDNAFVARKVIVNPRTFKVRGKLLDINTTTKKMVVNISSSNYKPELYVGKTIDIDFPGEMLFFHLGKLQQADTVKAQSQRVQVEGKVVDEGVFEATKMYNPV